MSLKIITSVVDELITAKCVSNRMQKTTLIPNRSKLLSGLMRYLREVKGLDAGPTMLVPVGL